MEVNVPPFKSVSSRERCQDLWHHVVFSIIPQCPQQPFLPQGSFEGIWEVDNCLLSVWLVFMNYLQAVLSYKYFLSSLPFVTSETYYVTIKLNYYDSASARMKITHFYVHRSKALLYQLWWLKICLRILFVLRVMMSEAINSSIFRRDFNLTLFNS